MKSLKTKLPSDLTVARTARRRRKGRTPEGQVLSDCMSLFRLRGWLAWRINSGSRPDATGRPVFFLLGSDGKPFRGFADLLFLVPGGRFGVAEIKRPGGKPTPHQRAFLNSVWVDDGVALLIDNVATLARALDVLTADPFARLDLAGNREEARP